MEKPKPYKWMCREGVIVECYDFQYWKRSDPPPIDSEPVIIDFKGVKHG